MKELGFGLVGFCRLASVLWATLGHIAYHEPPHPQWTHFRWLWKSFESVDESWTWLPFDKDSSRCNQRACSMLLPHSREGVGREDGGSLSIVRKQELSKCPSPKPVSSRTPVWGMQVIQGEPLHWDVSSTPAAPPGAILVHRSRRLWSNLTLQGRY